MSRKLFANIWGIFSLVVSVFLSACGQQNATAPDVQKSAAEAAAVAAVPAASEAKRHIVIIGVDARSVPLTFWDENARNENTKLLAGYDADLARETFKRAGLEYEFKAIAWANKESELKNKHIDVVWSGLTITDARAKDFAFSVPYYKNRQAILVRADAPIQSKEDLKGKKIGEHKGSPSGPFIQSLHPSEHEEFLELPDLFAAVLNGQIDAAVTDGVFIDYYVLGLPGKFRVLQDHVSEKGFAVGVRHGEKELLDKINRALTSMETDGTAAAIYKRWFGENN